ncbi:MAG: T9SS type A sorting domain-containing protein [Bacteroidetes bacterium]|nr:T9SS type A sorting domain-containing protein [Bacteroidota bacterium]
MKRLAVLILFFPLIVIAQNYTSYFTGNIVDTVTMPSGGICLMGGATEDDNAMKWFLQNTNGGDVLVLRTSGTNGYNNYLYSGLGIPVNSVETIVCNSAAASNDAYVQQRIQQAEAIWFAGGDQWKYISYWRNTPVDSLINDGIKQRHIVIGGTSAGMAIEGKYYFSAQNGTVTSTAALANPFNSMVTVDSAAFISHAILNNVVTDTHFDNPDRRGRLCVFLARIFSDYGIYGKAIACDEYTAVCIDTTGNAKVFGGYPAYDDNAYFIQTNCELTNQAPENCSSGNPLTWNLGGEALRVYQVKGNASGQNTFDLNDWKTGAGGTWLNWSVNAGAFNSQNGNPINCNSSAILETKTDESWEVFPNPVEEQRTLTIRCKVQHTDTPDISLYNSNGQKVHFGLVKQNNNVYTLFFVNLTKGIYLLQINGNEHSYYTKKIILN